MFAPFDNTTDATANSILSYLDDTIVAAGAATFEGSGEAFALARFRPNGQRYSVFDPPTLIPNQAKVSLPFPFNHFERKMTPATINLQVQFAELASPLFVTGIAPAFFEHNARVYRFPVRNPPQGVWKVSQGHAIGSNHQGSDSQRYAYDIGVIDPSNGNTNLKDACDVAALIQQYANDPNYDYDIDPNGDYEPKHFSECRLAYGLPIYAAASGVVVSAGDGYPNNFPSGTKLPELALPESDPNHIPGGGNAVSIDHGNGEFSFYAHMRPGSVLVTAGQVVTQGQKLGEVGNTGSSGGTHLHFHLMDNWSPTGHGDGLPVYFTDVSFEFPDGKMLRQLRSGFGTGALLDITPTPVPQFDFPGIVYGPGNVAEVGEHNTLRTAQRLELPVIVSGGVAPDEEATLADAGDGVEDIYRFTLSENRAVVARLSFDPGVDLDLVLFDAVLAAKRPASGTRSNRPEVVVAGLSSGTYYVFVSQFDATPSASLVPYSLELELFVQGFTAVLGTLSPAAFKTGPSQDILAQMMADVEAEVLRDDHASALRTLERLRENLDGCGARADANDLVIDCVAQRALRNEVDKRLTDLGGRTTRTR